MKLYEFKIAGSKQTVSINPEYVAMVTDSGVEGRAVIHVALPVGDGHSALTVEGTREDVSQLLTYEPK